MTKFSIYYIQNINLKCNVVDITTVNYDQVLYMCFSTVS